MCFAHSSNWTICNWEDQETYWMLKCHHSLQSVAWLNWVSNANLPPCIGFFCLVWFRTLISLQQLIEASPKRTTCETWLHVLCLHNHDEERVSILCHGGTKRQALRLQNGVPAKPSTTKQGDTLYFPCGGSSPPKLDLMNCSRMHSTLPSYYWLPIYL